MLDELDAMLQLLPSDVDLLEQLFPQGVDERVDELVGGLATHEASLIRIRAWVAQRKESDQ